ncbi:MAG: efflux RND transporter periplasmic adaptor subunit [Planctomycetota bacterium]
MEAPSPGAPATPHSSADHVVSAPPYRSSSLNHNLPAAKRSTWRSHLLTLVGSVALLVIVGLVIAAVAWTKFEQFEVASSAPAPPEMPVSVQLSEPQRSSFRGTSVVVGSALAHRWVVVRTEQTGVVTAIPMKPGGTVKTGDLLVQIDDRVEKAQLKAATATLNQALALLQRSKKLQRANANSAEELDIAIANAQRAEAEVDRLDALIDRKRITAEFDARVGLFDLHVGQYLAEGTDVATLEGLADYLHVDFSVPAHVADQIAVGDRVGMSTNESSPLETAEIIAMDSRADPQSRSLKVRARLDHPPETLLPGDSVMVTVQYGPPMDAVLVPQTAVRRSPSGTTVFRAVETASEDGAPPTLRAKATQVTLAGSDGTMSRIVGGLTPDDRVVTNGSFKVMDGSLLLPIDVADQDATAPKDTP